MPKSRCAVRGLGAVAQRREVGDQADVPEQQRDRQRRSRPRTRPRSAGCGTAARCPSCSGTGTASRPRATDGRCGSAGTCAAQATAKSVIASANRLIDVRQSCLKQQQDRGDQRAGVADADPPDEVDDREAPADRDVDAPDPDALEQQPGDRDISSTISSMKPMPKPKNHAERRAPRQDDRG